MANYCAKFVKCPFFHRYEDNRIVCEGLAERNTINLVFEIPEDRKQYMNHYCYGIFECRDCHVHMMLDSKYEEDSDEQIRKH